MMVELLQSLSSLLSSKASHTATLTSLMIERLYYADGRHHPEHPNHKSFQGLTSLSRALSCNNGNILVGHCCRTL